MLTIPPTWRRRLFAGAAVGAAALALAACGSSSYTPPVAVTPPPVATDAFVTFLQSKIATSNDTDLPFELDGSPSSEPDTTEPVPVT